MSEATSAVKERPILFSGPMVRAILDGRKTQTRRAVSPQPKKSTIGFSPAISGEHWIAQWVFDARALGRGRATMNGDSHRCPFAPVGSRLWVRETWVSGHVSYGDEYVYENGNPVARTWYRANGDLERWIDDEGELTERIPWRPSIHMPRWASRLTLEITRVRVERLQDISAEDAVAEGVTAGDAVWSGSARNAFRESWDSINAKRGLAWAANPWVWAIDFRRIAP